MEVNNDPFASLLVGVAWCSHQIFISFFLPCVMLMMYRMSTHPHVVSLRWTYASPFSFAGLNKLSTFLGQENNKLYFFLHALIFFYEQASSHTS